MAGYEVVPDALYAMVQEFNEASNVWRDLQAGMHGWSMDTFTLGMLGEAVGYPAGYNEVLEKVFSKVDEAMESFVGTEVALREVARTYGAQDAEYYERFGYVEEELDNEGETG